MKKRGVGRKRLFSCAIALFGSCLPGCNHGSPADPAPPASATYVLNFDSFSTTIDPILSGQGCDNENCHGGNKGGDFRLSPPGSKDAHYDFNAACTQITPADLKSSPLLMKPLAEECGGTTHAGGAFFFSLDDPNYVAMMQWVFGGTYR
jgi:hypothetical protein